MRCLTALFTAFMLTGPAHAQSLPQEVLTDVYHELAMGSYIGWEETPTDQDLQSVLKIYQADWGLPVTGVLTQDLADHISRKIPATQGRWIETTAGCKVWSERPLPQETVTWTGDCDDGKISGTGTQQWRFLRQGETRVTTYFGDTLGGRYHGTGSYIQWNGFVYFGGFRDDKAEGQGTMVYPTGVIIRGTFRDDKVNGQAVVEFKDGMRYQGEMLNDQRHGQGTATFEDGDSYQGAWQANQPNGQGTAVLGGKTYTGVWVNGCFSAEPSGSVYLFASAEECQQN